MFMHNLKISASRKKTQHAALRHCKSIFSITVIVFAALLAMTTNANAQTIIRDMEIEQALKLWATPVIEAANLSPDGVNFILIQDPAVNAFVAGGPNIFIFTGLIEKSDNPQEIIGVISHELGHITGGHLIRGRNAMENASYESLVGTLLGIGAAVLTGEGGLGAAISAGSQSSAIGRYLAFSRVQESSADQAAINFLEDAQMNPTGLVTFMEKLENQELLPASQQSEYIRTHPLTRDRISALEEGRKHSPYKDKATPALWTEQHKRIVAKLKAFISPERVAWDYSDKDHSIAADYARAIASYRQNKVDEALTRIDALIKTEPDNPYFFELKGQMLLEFGQINEAIIAYKKSVSLTNEAPLIQISYAHALIESHDNQDANLNEAIKQLKKAYRVEPRSIKLQRLLATAYGKQGHEALAQLHLAEEAFLKNDMAYAKRRAEIASKGLEEGSADWIRAQDLINFIDQRQEKQQNKR